MPDGFTNEQLQSHMTTTAPTGTAIITPIGANLTGHSGAMHVKDAPTPLALAAGAVSLR